MAIPLAALAIPALSALGGGIAGYKEGGIGGAVLGGAAGAALPAGLRLAGTALAGTGLAAKYAPQLYKAANVLGQVPRGPLTQGAAMAAGRGLIPTALVAGGTALLPGKVGAMAGGLARPLGQGAGNAAQVAAGLAGTQRPGPSIYGGDPYDAGLLGNYGGVQPGGSPIEVLGPPGMGRTAETLRQGAASLAVQKGFNQENYDLTNAYNKQQMARQLAAAGIRQNIATRANMLQNAQTGAINMGQQAMADSGRILTSNFQYQ